MSASAQRIHRSSVRKHRAAGEAGLTVIELFIGFAISMIAFLALSSVYKLLVTGMNASLISEEENNFRNVMVPSLISDLRTNDYVEVNNSSAGVTKIIIYRPKLGVMAKTGLPPSTLPQTGVPAYIQTKQFDPTDYDTITWISENKPEPAPGAKVIRRLCNTSCSDITFSNTAHVLGIQLKVINKTPSEIQLRFEARILNATKQNVLSRNDFTVNFSKGRTYEIIR